MLIEQPFLLNLDLNPNMSEDEERKEIEQHLDANRMIMGLLDGTTDPNDCLDVVEWAGVDPMLYADAVAGAIEGVIRRGEILILE